MRPRYKHKNIYLFIYLLVFFVALGFELRAYTLHHATSSFVKGFLKIGSFKLFSQAGFELQCS
jgi:hypothetical protein